MDFGGVIVCITNPGIVFLNRNKNRLVIRMTPETM